MKYDSDKWNDRYAGAGLYLGRGPSRFLAENITLVKGLAAGKKALDIACGEGRNSIFLARHGFDVTGLDISEEGLSKAEKWAEADGLAVTFHCIDLENFAFTESYDLIINFNFLLRSLVPMMVDFLNPGGVIVFDTILDSPTLEGFHNREYLLQPGELREIFSPFSGEILLYEELPFGPSPTARLIFHKNRSEDA
ncbi:MAG TPA: class I SAM-dependent methyltransferase [Geobacteraceae bacterium]|nr:class I SAM-dependent methyltransferase [Geobacteraceae bacterium]